MDRSSDGIAALSVQDATATLPSATPPTPSYSAHSSSTPLAASPPSSKPQHVSAIMDTDNAAGAEDRSRRATSVLSMDDLEAAQALEGLRTGIILHRPNWVSTLIFVL